MKHLGMPWRYLARSVILFFDEFYLMVGLSLLCSVALLTVVLAPAAAAGLIAISSRMAADKRVNMDFFWQGAKARLGMTYRVMGLWGGMLLLFLFNVYFYLARLTGSLRYVAGFWAYMAILWVVVGFYLLPILQRMTAPTVKSVYLNAFVLAFRQPLYSLAVLVQFILLSLLWRYLPPLAVLAWPGLMALIVCFATNYGLAVMRGDEPGGSADS